MVVSKIVCAFSHIFKYSFSGTRVLFASIVDMRDFIATMIAQQCSMIDKPVPFAAVISGVLQTVPILPLRASS